MKQKGVDKEIRRTDFLHVFLRSFLIQASWSFERMQSLGFAYALDPVLRKLYPDDAEYEARLKLHMEYFNTQPYLASFILGAAVRLEYERASGRNVSADVQGMKVSLMGPLGALGDSFFWGAVKPLAAVIAVALLMTGFLWAPLVFLILYNVAHVGIRAAALFRGYASCGNAMDLMGLYRFTIMAKRFKIVSLCVAGGILGVLPAWMPQFSPTLPMPEFFAVLAGMVFTVLLIILLRMGGSPVKLMLGLAVFCLVLAFAGVL